MPPPSLMQSVLDGPLPHFVALVVRFMCVVCRTVLKDPWQTECGHRMCFTCMNELLVDGTEVRCPANEEDCEMITREKMFYDRGMCREILSQQVYCIHKDAGCTSSMKWSELQDWPLWKSRTSVKYDQYFCGVCEKHLETCEFITVECPFKKFGCTAKVPRKCQDEHVKGCQYVPVPCVNCRTEVGRILLKTHIEKDCPKVLVECPYGCGEKVIRNQMETHKQNCILRPQQCQYHFIGCTFEGSDSEVSTHELTAHQEHFDVLVRRVEEDDLKRTRLETRLEEQTNENVSVKRQLNEANRKITQLEERVTAVQGETDRLKSEHETFATRTELGDQERRIQETLTTTENQVGEVEQRVTNMEQNSGSRVGGPSGETLREMEATSQQVGVHDIRLAEMDVRFQCLETANYEGVLLWKVSDYARRKQDAFQSRVMSLYSQPFYTSRYGYKMCGRVYLNGDGMGKGTHLSLFFVLMRGEYDALLEWPFRQKVTLSLLDQSPARRDLSDTFRPDPTSSSFRRPSTEMNIASGCPMFISHNDLQNSRFLKDDTLYMKIVVDTIDLVPR